VTGNQHLAIAKAALVAAVAAVVLVVILAIVKPASQPQPKEPAGKVETAQLVRPVQTVKFFADPPETGAPNSSYVAPEKPAPIVAQKPAPIVAQNPSATIKTIDNQKPRRVSTIQQNVCTRHNMRKEITNGGRSWRCRR
jgi:hypothetical protein